MSRPRRMDVVSIAEVLMHIPANKTGAAIVAALTFVTLAGYARYRPEGGAATRPTASTSAQNAAHAAAIAPPAEPSAGRVSMSAKLDRNALMHGGDGDVHVALTLRAGASDGHESARKPTDALVILDISGSMEGQKLDYAKQALHELIDRLATVDRFALVTYDSNAEVVVPLAHADGAGTARFHRTVDALETAGGTNMSAGLDLAREALAGRDRAGRSARVILLSDGHANEGDSSADGLLARARKLVENDDVLSTMGVGDDFNEDLMTALADTGTGNFYYLSRVALLGRFFDAELRAAAQTVASALELRFDGAAGAQLVDLGGYPIERRGGAAIVRPGSLYAGQERVLWATVRAPTSAAGEVALGKFALRFKDDEVIREVPPLALPLVACVTDESRFEQAIVRPIWEEYVATEQFQKAQAALGRAIGEGDGADVEREQQAYESNRGLAEKLGSARVLKQLAAMVTRSDAAKAAQNAPVSERKFNAKQTKSRALFERRRDAYNDNPLLGL